MRPRGCMAYMIYQVSRFRKASHEMALALPMQLAISWLDLGALGVAPSARF
jgi:hypothetical protein